MIIVYWEKRRRGWIASSSTQQLHDVYSFTFDFGMLSVSLLFSPLGLFVLSDCILAVLSDSGSGSKNSRQKACRLERVYLSFSLYLM